MLTLPVLAWVPVGTSLILGMMYLHLGEARFEVKFLGTLIFVVASYFQFFSSHSLAGLLLQVGLALCLAMWHRVSALE